MYTVRGRELFNTKIYHSIFLTRKFPDLWYMYLCDWFVQKRDQEATEFKLTKREIEEREEKRQEEMRRELQKAIKRKAEREKEKEAREEEMVSS